jgi:polyhydroxyalkanoate synthesis regulator phasin
MVVTEVRRYMEAAVEKLTPAKAQAMARSLLEGQSKGREQVQRLAQDLMEWSNQTRERMSEMVRREVARQLKTIGVASREEVDALRARVRELERGGRSAAKNTGRSAVKSSSKTSAKRPAKTAAKAVAKRRGAPAAKGTAASTARRPTRAAGGEGS